MDCSPSSSSVHGILQARILECVAIPISRGIFPTRVFCIAGRFFTIWDIREAHHFLLLYQLVSTVMFILLLKKVCAYCGCCRGRFFCIRTWHKSWPRKLYNTLRLLQLCISTFLYLEKIRLLSLLCPSLHEIFHWYLSFFLEEISSHSHSIVFLCFFALITEESFLISLRCSLELCIKMGISVLFSCAFSFFLFSAICKASSDNHFAFLHFFFLGKVLIAASYTMSWTSVHSSSGTLSIRYNPLNLFVTSTV